MSPVEVTWLDAFSDTNSWISKEDITNEACETKSVGYLIPDAKEGHVVIAQSFNSFELIDSVLSIPVAMVSNIRVMS